MMEAVGKVLFCVVGGLILSAATVALGTVVAVWVARHWCGVNV